MIRTLLRAPAGVAEVFADLLRLLAVISIVVAGIGWGPLSAVSFVSALIVMLVPRLLGLSPRFDIAFGAVILASTWSSVLGVYLTTRWWDLPMHFLTNGLCAALLYVVLVRLGIVADAATLPRPMLSTAVVTTALGLSLGAFWEFFEWFGHTFIDGEIFVGYIDSLGDLFWGGLGSLLAGCGMRFLMGRSRTATEPLSSTPG
jgi:hypothetical protein